ncbi:MAG: 16S rRNA (cytosine(1402)-N(4))-methyltransferase RsmH [Bacillota bacterium]|nr:16S rRNA (cytosine(1402)-N(4))-methyltransferase RsmH [Bacillota bacterium]
MVELHLPVMEKEVMTYLIGSSEGTYVDATLGDGGHAEAICRRLTGKGRLIGLDWDHDALQRADVRLKQFECRLTLIHESYTRLVEVLEKIEAAKVDGILIDLGASTLQLMDPERGFSFHHQGDLDMRMDRRRSLTAKEIVNEYSSEQLADIFFRYGEERWSKRIAARIIRFREQEGPLTDSRQLAEVVKEAVPARYRRHGGHPSRRVFQALRLAVNGELENISTVLPQAVSSLAPGGRICVISYHSLEDRLIKLFFREKAKSCDCPPYRPCICEKEPELKVLTGKAVKPSEDEINKNPRARSARLRAAERKGTAHKKAGV